MDENNFQPMKNENPAGLSIASMVLGIASLVLMCFIPYLPVVTAIIGIVLGAIALKNNAGGRGMAIAGLVLSIIVVVLYVIALILVAVGASFLSGYLGGL